MKTTVAILITLMCSAAVCIAAVPSRCVLERSVVLGPYSHPDRATLDEWAASRRALDEFVTCPPANVDPQSRKVFFEAVVDEFETSHDAEMRRWKTVYPDAESLGGAIAILQAEMRSYMAGLVDRGDDSSKAIVLRFGDAKAIAALGPSAKKPVLGMLGNSTTAYGLSNRYNSRDEAIQVLGYWIDPANLDFPVNEKEEFTHILTSLIPLMTGRHSELQTGFYTAAMKSLAHSDSSEAEVALATWMGAQADQGSALYHEASAALKSIQRHREKRQ